MLVPLGRWSERMYGEMHPHQAQIDIIHRKAPVFGMKFEHHRLWLQHEHHPNLASISRISTLQLYIGGTPYFDNNTLISPSARDLPG